MVPGEVYELDIPMFPTGWVVKKGHRLRLAVSGADFPNLWPTPYEATNRVYRGGQYASRIVLPVVPESKLSPPQFLPAPHLETIVKSYGEAPSQQTIVDQIKGTVTVTNKTAGTVVLEDMHFSPRGEAKCVRGPSGRGASRLARAGVLEPYVEHGKQAQRSPGGRIACFDRRVVRNAAT